MGNRIGVGVAIAMALAAPLIGAAAPSAGLPEYVGIFEASDGKGGYEPLERQTPKSRVKVRVFGFGGASTGYQVDGERSPVRLTVAQASSFVVRTASQDTDPAALVQFFIWKPLKGQRVLDLSTAGSMGLSQHDQTAALSVPFAAQKFGSQYFVVRPTTPLAPGEYGLGTVDGKDLFLFGVE